MHATGAGTLGLAAVIIGLGAAVFAILAEDQKLETFALHCFWGNAPGEGSGPFAGTMLGQWKSKPEQQLEALLHLLFGFTVAEDEAFREHHEAIAIRLAAIGKTAAAKDARRNSLAVTVDYGATLESSRFHVEWEVRHDSGDVLTVTFRCPPGYNAVISDVSSSHPYLMDRPKRIDGDKPSMRFPAPRLRDPGFQFVESVAVRIHLEVDGQGHREPAEKPVVWSARWSGTDFDPDGLKASVDY